MKCLAELQEEAQKDETKREMLIIHPKSGPHNCRWIDPFMGMIEMKQFPGKFVLIDDLDKYNTIGLFIDQPE